MAALARSRKHYSTSGVLPNDIVDTLVDPDDLATKIKPAVIKKQVVELKFLEPLITTFSSHLQPFLSHARAQVWSVLNAGSVSTRQARKLVTLYGWDETLFMRVFHSFGSPGPVTVRRNSPVKPPVQPTSFEAAWASKKKREVQFILCAGATLDKWCSFQQFPASVRRFYASSGYKKISAKLVTVPCRWASSASRSACVENAFDQPGHSN